MSAASASALALAHLDATAAAAAAVGSICGLIDAVNPGGQLRNAHLKAVHKLRDVEHDVVNEWRIARLKGEGNSNTAAEILRAAKTRRDRIATELRTAETSFARAGNQT